MEFDDVRAFVSVAETRSVSLAARDLNVTQSAVTRRLQRLAADQIARRRPAEEATAGRDRIPGDVEVSVDDHKSQENNLIRRAVSGNNEAIQSE